LLQQEDPIKLDQVISGIIDTFSPYQHDSPVGNLTGSDMGTFFWGPEAMSYFCFDNIYDEVAIGVRWNCVERNSVHEITVDILRKVGLKALVKDSGAISPWELSGGQQQRLLTAIILSRKPELVIAFDPLIYVDHHTRRSIYELVCESILNYEGKIIFTYGDSAVIQPMIEKELVPIGDCYIVRCYSSQRNEAQELNSAEIESVQQKGQIATEVARVERFLEMNNLRLVYPNGRVGIEVESAEFVSGKVYVVCGPNGGGKSSFARLLCSQKRLGRASHMYYDGRPVKIPFRDLVKTGKLVFTFQDPNVHIVGGTVYDFLLPRARAKLADKAHIMDYLEDDILSVPFWVRQASVFLNALESGAEILILDEPIDGLSYIIFGDEAIDLLTEKAESGAIVLIITHNPELARRISDNYLWISENQVKLMCCKESPADDKSAFVNWLFH